MKKLIQGIIDFRRTSMEDYRHKFSKLASRQKPDALLVACCDSRVVPNIFASSDPGDVFVLRNIGNLVPPYHSYGSKDASSASAIEFSIATLGVSDIIICGHSDCGAMQELIEKQANPNDSLPLLSAWLKNAAPSYKRFVDSRITRQKNLSSCNCLSQVNVLQQLDNLKTYPLVRNGMKNNTLEIHGWWFDLATADVYYYNLVREEFVVIREDEVL